MNILNNREQCNFVVVDEATNTNQSDSIELEKAIRPIVENINTNIFGFRLNGANDSVIKSLQQNDRGEFDWQNHSPIGLNDSHGFCSLGPSVHWNKLTVILVLTEPKDYEGGEISLIEPGQAIDCCVKTFKLEEKSILVMPSFIEYKIHGVTSGIARYLITQYKGPRWS